VRYHSAKDTVGPQRWREVSEEVSFQKAQVKVTWYRAIIERLAQSLFEMEREPEHANRSATEHGRGRAHLT